jgi:hypothetical protein
LQNRKSVAAAAAAAAAARKLPLLLPVPASATLLLLLPRLPMQVVGAVLRLSMLVLVLTSPSVAPLRLGALLPQNHCH